MKIKGVFQTLRNRCRLKRVRDVSLFLHPNLLDIVKIDEGSSTNCSFESISEIEGSISHSSLHESFHGRMVSGTYGQRDEERQAESDMNSDTFADSVSDYSSNSYEALSPKERSSTDQTLQLPEEHFRISDDELKWLLDDLKDGFEREAVCERSLDFRIMNPGVGKMQMEGYGREGLQILRREGLNMRQRESFSLSTIQPPKQPPSPPPETSPLLFHKSFISFKPTTPFEKAAATARAQNAHSLLPIWKSRCATIDAEITLQMLQGQGVIRNLDGNGIVSLDGLDMLGG